MNNKDYILTKKLGKKILLARVNAGLNQEELAYKAGVSRAIISYIERGIKSPSVETVGAIANALEIELYKLFMFD